MPPWRKVVVATAVPPGTELAGLEPVPDRFFAVDGVVVFQLTRDSRFGRGLGPGALDDVSLGQVH